MPASTSLSEAQIRYSRLPTDEPPPGKVDNMIVLSNEFYEEVRITPFRDLEAAKALSSAPAALDLYTRLTYRCFSANSLERLRIV